MLIIINDDPAYVSWLKRHRRGFVVDAPRKLVKNRLMLHRATCSIVKPHKRARLTTGGHLKACSLDAEELAEWAIEQTGSELTACGECQPDCQEPPSDEERAKHALTHLGGEIVSYVLDLAVMYLDGEERHYGPSVGAIAVYLDKTPKQIVPALVRLLDDDYLTCRPASESAPSAESIVYPTARALRTIPAFEEMAPDALAAELASLERLE